MFGQNTINQTNSSFGTSAAAPTTGFGFGTSQPNATNTLFGAASAAPTSTFGTQPISTTTASSVPTSSVNNSIFGSNTSTSSAPTLSFGTTTTSKPTFGASITAAKTNSTFGTGFAQNTTAAPQQQQQQQQQQQHFLDLQHCFPDTNMSSYIVKPDSITRSTDLVNQLFGGNASRSFSQQQKALKTNSRESLSFNENPVELPLFLSASDHNHSVKL